MKKCPSCGAEADTNQVFCQHCGARLRDAGQSKAETEQLYQEIRQRDTEISNLKERLAQAERIHGINKGTGKKWKVFCVILLVTNIAFGIFAVYQGSKATYYRSRYNSTSYECSTLEEQNAALSKQTEFMDEYIGIINSDSNDKLYHTYACTTWADWSGDWSIHAYNITAAENQGYEPCPECH